MLLQQTHSSPLSPETEVILEDGPPLQVQQCYDEGHRAQDRQAAHEGGLTGGRMRDRSVRPRWPVGVGGSKAHWSAYLIQRVGGFRVQGPSGS